MLLLVFHSWTLWWNMMYRKRIAVTRIAEIMKKGMNAGPWYRRAMSAKNLKKSEPS